MPAATKADCQPQVSTIQGTTAGAMIAPTFAPELNMLVASARSFFGNQSATALIADGKLPPSPRPSAMRTLTNPEKLPTKAWAIATALHTVMDTAYPSFVPNLSMNHPNPSSPIPYAPWNAAFTLPKSAFVHFNCSSRIGLI